ncbi:MAG TPA: D-alanyl-D-alanine carboxypeptidase/D-alanyl-D-alanine-endopeptidase [Jatrophihabitantaceae bacterium]
MSVQIPRRAAVAVVCVLAAAALAAVPLTQAGSAPASTSQLGADLDRILADQRLAGGQVGLEVRDAATGDVLYEHNAQNRLLPASNAKLFTSTAAMDVLGPDYRFTTSVAANRPTSHGTLLGNLYLKGTGDPTMLGPDYDALAKAVADSGVRTVVGNLVADDTYFDDVRLAPFWAWDDEPYYYNAQISALTVAPNTDYDAGTVIVHIAPGAAAGAPARVSVVPANHYVHLVGSATTGAPGSSDTADAVRRHGNNTIDVSGSIPAGSTGDDVWATVWEPTQLVASIFRDALRAHGIRVLGGTSYAATPAGTHALVSHDSMTLTQLLTPFLKLSNNMHAEHLVKAMGEKVRGEGTWDAGTTAVLDDAATMGVDTSQVRMVDGSGLSRADLLTPQQITNLLIAARGKPWFTSWYEALPVAGNPDRFTGGTLRNRMRNTPAANNLHGKTGSMTAVSALSGYVTDAAGEQLVFSMISNNFLPNGITSIEDAVGVALAGYGGADPATVAPATVAPATVAPADPPARTPGQRRNPDLECAWVKAC